MKFYLDFEATQFSERIISIGCVAENGKTFSTLVKPTLKKDKVNKFITKLTGITNEMLANAPSADAAFVSLHEFVQVNTKGNDKAEYFCYGTSDKQFLERTANRMSNKQSIIFTRHLQENIQDYSQIVKDYFNTTDDIGLKRLYILVEEKLIEQHHDALEDAQMLCAIAKNLKNKCKPEDVEKLAAIPKTPKLQPDSSNLLPKAPRKFIEWTGDKWEVDTGASAEDWSISVQAGPHIKYFNSKEILMMWLMRYFTSGLSIKNIEHQNKVYSKIDLALATNKHSWGLTWTERKINNNA